MLGHKKDKNVNHMGHKSSMATNAIGNKHNYGGHNNPVNFMNKDTIHRYLYREGEEMQLTPIATLSTAS